MRKRKEGEFKTRTEQAKEALENRKKYARITYTLTFLLLVITVVDFFLRYQPIDRLFLNPFLLLFIIGVICSIILYMLNWKQRITLLERELVYTIGYRQTTSLSELAKAKRKSKDEIAALVKKLFQEGKLSGKIRGEHIILKTGRSPNCLICSGPIQDVLNRLSLCPYCKSPFHKDHLLDYLADVDNKCPQCKHRLETFDLVSR